MALDVSLSLIDDLFREADPLRMCRHIKRDEQQHPYCGNLVDESGKPTLQSIAVTDAYSLQLWCLCAEHARCIYYSK